jgi:SAM-dependent methyltransferase
MAEALHERGLLRDGVKALGFGVGQERLPALFAKYGVRVMATDQDFTTRKAGHWAKHELAHGTQDLNRFKICDPEKFKDNVEYMPVDMTNIPKQLAGEYDFLWSNCALGHLGDIEKSLKFIKSSLDCLKPGGWAVHTTEFNILSDEETVTSGSTVVFRARDIYELQKSLTEKGYIVSPFILTLGNDPKDQRVSMRPIFGNDLSKIQVMGYLATQIVLIIQRPTVLKPARSNVAGMARLLSLKAAYQRNKTIINRYRTRDTTIKPILESQSAGIEALRIHPKREEVTVKVKQGESVDIRLKFINKSAVPIFSAFSRLGDSKPVVLATTNPNDRASSFMHDSWPGEDKNRLATDLWVRGTGKNAKKAGEWELADYVQPGQAFAFQPTLHTNGLAKGEYVEHFCLVQEYVGWVESSTVQVKIEII